MIDPNNTDTGFMINAAVRYCLGRNSYAPALCVDWLRGHWDQLRDQDKALILRDIADHVRESEAHDTLWLQDLDTWKRFLETVGEELPAPRPLTNVDAEVGELKRQVAVLQIQNSRLRTERDQARAWIKQDMPGYQPAKSVA